MMSTQIMPDTVGRYSLMIEWSDEDGLYIVTVPELPGCRTHGATQVEAVEMGRDAIETWLEANHASMRTVYARKMPPTLIVARTERLLERPFR